MMSTRTLILAVFGLAVLAAPGHASEPTPTNEVAQVTDSGTSKTNTPATPVATKPSSTRGTNSVAKNDLDAFKIIADRNIFNPNRSARVRGGSSEPKKVIKTESFALVGIMSYSKGDFAFFEGSSSSYKKVVKPEESIAGYRVSEIQSSQVTLTNEGKVFVLHVGDQMRRQDEGPWEISKTSGTASSTSASGSGSSSDSATSSDDSADDKSESDILKRLMQKRERESKNE